MNEITGLIVTAAASGVGGAAGAWLALRDRVTAIEHEIWGVKGNNGMKSVLAALIVKEQEE